MPRVLKIKQHAFFYKKVCKCFVPENVCVVRVHHVQPAGGSQNVVVVIQQVNEATGAALE